MDRNHWLYGKDKRKFKVEEETNCDNCVHKELCRSIRTPAIFEKLCLNYSFGTSQYSGCDGCHHKFTRWDKDSIPCFFCKFFEETKE